MTTDNDEQSFTRDLDASDIRERLRISNMTTWLETEAIKKGTDEQRERWAARVLPEDELLRLAREELFAGFAELERWHTNEVRRAMRQRLKHSKECSIGRGLSDAAHPSFEVTDVTELDAMEWARLKAIQALVKEVNEHPWLRRLQESATVDSFTHWATCPTCKAEVFRSGAKVSIPWAGRTLVREFTL